MLATRTTVRAGAVSALAALLALGTGTAAFGVDASQPSLDRAGDVRADRGLFFLEDSGDITWQWRVAGTGGLVADRWGNHELGDIPIVGDFDGDGRNDPVVYRPGSPSRWFINGTASGQRTIAFGQEGSGDVPLHGDFDGDRRADLAVARPGPGGQGPWTWFISGSTGRNQQLQWGETSTDTAVPANYVGDARTDIAVRRFEADGSTAWYVRNDNGSATRIGWGDADDLAVSGDYDGDGRSDVAVVRVTEQATYRWFLRLSAGGQSVVEWGDVDTDWPTWHDHDGDGRSDLGVLRYSQTAPVVSILRRSTDARAEVLSTPPGGRPTTVEESLSTAGVQDPYIALVNGVFDPEPPVMAASAVKDGPVQDLADRWGTSR